MLSHIRVIDFTRLLPGPYATLRLADMGAEILKVEDPAGDPARYATPDGKTRGRGQDGPVFLANNRNKRSIVLDLKTPEGRDKARALVSTADVVIESFRPGVADKLGIGYEDLRQVRQDIVYCSLTGYGQSGPLSALGGHDLNYMARSGVLTQLLDEHGTPVVPSLQFGDFIGGIVATEAILAALVERDRTGTGKYLDISMTHALMGLLTNHALLLGRGMEDGLKVLAGRVVCYRLYRTRDDRYVSLAALEPKFWQNFCDFFQKPQWMSEQMSAADASNPTFVEIEQLFAQRDLVEWSAIADELDACVAPVLTASEALSSQSAVEHETVFTVEAHHRESLLQTRTHAGGLTARKRTVTPPPKLGDWLR